MTNISKVLKPDSNNKTVTIFTLFTTTGTLLCCALPILFVTLGMGATVVAMTSTFPFLMLLTQYKIWVFVFSGCMLLLSGWLMFRPGRYCPVDMKLSFTCNKAHKINKRIYWSSVLIWCIGFFAAYLLLPIRIWLDV